MEESKNSGGLGLLAEVDKQQPYMFNSENYKAAIKKLLAGEKKVRMIWNGKLKRYVEYKSKR